jgi:hypothetical protein
MYKSQLKPYRGSLLLVLLLAGSSISYSVWLYNGEYRVRISLIKIMVILTLKTGTKKEKNGHFQREPVVMLSKPVTFFFGNQMVF